MNKLRFILLLSFMTFSSVGYPIGDEDSPSQIEVVFDAKEKLLKAFDGVVYEGKHRLIDKVSINGFDIGMDKKKVLVDLIKVCDGSDHWLHLEIVGKSNIIKITRPEVYEDSLVGYSFIFSFDVDHKLNSIMEYHLNAGLDYYIDHPFF
ncbi:MAG: hypothetical protein ACSHYA_20330 [Opitutaceae bacterium]